jgi:hypothetical protein
MINSMFSLDHRLAELRPTEDELRIARELRDAAAPATRPARSITETTRPVSTKAALGMPFSRLAAV